MRFYAGLGNNDQFSLVLGSTPISDTTRRTSTEVGLKDIDNVSYELWADGNGGTNTLAGSFGFEVSNDFTTDGDTAGYGANQNAGHWFDITADLSPAIPALTSGSGGMPWMVNFQFLPFRYIRCYFTPTSGTGFVYAYVIGKGL